MHQLEGIAIIPHSQKIVSPFTVTYTHKKKSCRQFCWEQNCLHDFFFHKVRSFWSMNQGTARSTCHCHPQIKKTCANWAVLQLFELNRRGYLGSTNTKGSYLMTFGSLAAFVDEYKWVLRTRREISYEKRSEFTRRDPQCS